MFTDLYLHIGNAVPNTCNRSIDQMFNHNIRFQVICQNQDEKDYLGGLCLVYGRQLQVDVWDEWLAQRKADKLCTEPLLPIVYSTFSIDLRGY